ncbi:MAG: efflux RND transporter periplasmic adaptor subunit [Acidobacteriota bacterium]
MNKIITISIITLMVGSFISLIGCTSEKGNAAADTQRMEKPPTNVSIMELSQSSLTEHIYLTGVTEPFTEVRISSEEGGIVEKLNFDKGDHVQKGKELIWINAQLLQASLEEARADLALKESNYQKAETLLERKSITAQDRLNAKTQYEMAMARYEQARIRLDKAIVESPISGVVVEKSVEEGEFVPPGGNVAVIQDLLKIRVSAALPEPEIPYIHRSSEAVITLDAFPGDHFKGHVSYIGNAANSVTRTFPMEVVLYNPGMKIKSGMVARLAIVKRVFNDAIVIPQDSIVQTEKGKFVFVLNGDRASRHEVKTGASSDSRIVIEEGLHFGDKLIIRSQKELVDGQDVNVVEE